MTTPEPRFVSKLLQFQKCLFLYLALLIPVPLEGVVVDGVAIGVEEDLAMLGADQRKYGHRHCFSIPRPRILKLSRQ